MSRFGPPRAAPLAFGWALLQPLRAAWWQLTVPELRALALKPAALTLGAGLALLVSTFLLAAPLQQALLHSSSFALRVVVHAVLAFVAVLLTLRLQAVFAGVYLEKMSLSVQRKVTGSAPEPSLGAGGALSLAVRTLVPGVKALVLWALTALLACTVVLIPVFGPLLVLPVQAAVAAGFLAHGAVADSRGRLQLPRWLYLRELACLSGLTVGFLPFVLFPPLMLLGAGSITIAGTLVALGAKARREAASALPPPSEHPTARPPPGSSEASPRSES
jgi:hypothetical protein